MKKMIIIALLLSATFISCDGGPFSCKLRADLSYFTLYKYNTGEQYRNNVLIRKTRSNDPIIITNRCFFHNGYSQVNSIQEAKDTANFFILSVTYDELDTMNDEWRNNIQDYIIPDVRISEMHTAKICDCKQLDYCYYKKYPFCTKDSNNIYHYNYSLDSTIINKMIDDETIWSYFIRVF